MEKGHTTYAREQGPHGQREQSRHFEGICRCCLLHRERDTLDLSIEEAESSLGYQGAGVWEGVGNVAKAICLLEFTRPAAIREERYIGTCMC